MQLLTFLPCQFTQHDTPEFHLVGYAKAFQRCDQSPDFGSFVGLDSSGLATETGQHRIGACLASSMLCWSMRLAAVKQCWLAASKRDHRCRSIKLNIVHRGNAGFLMLPCNCFGAMDCWFTAPVRLPKPRMKHRLRG